VPVVTDQRDTTREAYWRDLFKRYLYVIEVEDSDIEMSKLITSSEVITIRNLLTEAEDEYTP
jgi:hypothetical protein